MSRTTVVSPAKNSSDVSIDQIIELWEEAEHKGSSVDAVAGCGSDTQDTVCLYLAIDNDIIKGTGWTAQASVLAQGMAEYICRELIGKTVEWAKAHKWLEFGIWRHRTCSRIPLAALSEAITKYEKDTHDQARA